MIENAIRSGKIDTEESNRRSASKRKENEVNNTSMYSKAYSKSVTVSQPRKVAANQQSSSRHEPLQPLYPKWYDANAQCDYHARIIGHSIENCTTFKKLVERLIGMGVVKFDDSTKVENPLPNHTEGGVNMVGEDRRIKTDIADVKTPLRWVWKERVKKGLIVSEESCEKRENYCEFHHEVGHEIQECTGFRALIQGMMDNREVEFCEGVQEESHDNRRVPWNYDCNVTILGKEDVINKEEQDEGRHHGQMEARVEPIREETSVEKKKNVVEPEFLVNEPIKEEEAREFLKFIKHSEYSVVEQLHKQPARISVLALLLNSEGHRNALLKVLNETYVADDISINKLDRLVGNISADNFISFSDDEIPPGGTGSTRALHITARCKGCILPGVLVDNGSALNVLPLSTLNRLPVDSSHMKSCQNVVRAFDGTERRVMGRIDIPLLIGPTIYEVDFLFMDIKPSYSCLLGRPWIHSAGVVPSSLHQKLKLVSEGRVVTIDAEEDIIASVTNDAPYLETSDDAIECSFRSLEFVNTTFIREGNKIPMPRISRTTGMGLQLTVGKGALPRRGLGKYLQGRVEDPMLKDKQDRFGLGCKPDFKQMRMEQEKKQMRRRACLTGDEVEWEPMTFPHLSKTFVSGGFVYQGMLGVRSINTELGSIHAVYEEATRGRTLPDIRPYESERELNNWTAEEIPVVFRISSE
ncbi:uncharacterized protein [Gossypium hirsutum]|uniref:G-patch domain-containing protein n=1 Tax=Gossypium hirsutum TaxID=3635 RepID=A0ABM3AMH9_GOSHI|nr:uncharacterized protein LOC121220319 [Gossypium hirsutum]